MDTNDVKTILLISFVMFIPLSALCYSISRSKQRKREIERYIKILNIKDRELFEQRFPHLSFFVAVLFVTLLSISFWGLILFGNSVEFGEEYSYLFGNIKMMLPEANNAVAIENYQSGALLTFNMAFLGAYLWGIQSIARRYAMNDLIPIAYYNLGVRMIFASILALAIYHLSEALPNILASLISAEPTAGNANTSNTHLVMPIFAFLIGMFPQRGLKWLTEKFPLFAQQPDPSMQPLPLEMIEGITIYDRVRLQELGIDSCYDLANEDYIPSLFKTPFSPRRLINWILQAKMCVYFGLEVGELRKHGIHTVWQFNEHSEAALKALAKNTALTEDTLMMVKHLIAKDTEIKRLVEAQLKLSRYWNTGDEVSTDSDRDAEQEQNDTAADQTPAVQ